MPPSKPMPVLFVLVSTCLSSCVRADATDTKKAEPADRNERHSWSAIAYPALPCPWAMKTTNPSLIVWGEGKSKSLYFQLEFEAPHPFPDSLVSPDEKQLTIRLHYADGTVVEPLSQDSIE